MARIITRISLLIVVFVSSLTTYAATLTASSIMTSLQRQILSSPAIEVQFTIKGGKETVQGSAIIQGAAFTFTTPQVDVWYDGRTQWAYLPSTQEVTITEPTVDELTAVNPFAIMRSYETAYSIRRLPDVKTNHRVSLTPKNAHSGIVDIIITTDATSAWPTALQVKFDDGRLIDLQIDRISGRPAPPQEAFKYDTKRHPNADVIDLR